MGGMMGYWEQHLQSPSFWFRQADQLYSPGLELFGRGLAASEAFAARVKPQRGTVDQREMSEMDLAPVGLMLIGFAIENHLKGVLLSQLLKAGSRTLKELKGKVASSHDLSKLATDVGLVLSEEQSMSLRLLTEMVLWGGRYPRPKDAKFFYAGNEAMGVRPLMYGRQTERHIGEIVMIIGVAQALAVEG
jgi:hypothetical protein